MQPEPDSTAQFAMRYPIFSVVVFAALSIAIVLVSWQVTKRRIDANENAARLAEFTAVLGQIPFDSINFNTPQMIEPPHRLPGDTAVPLLTAQSNGKTAAWVLLITARGYNGPVSLMLGVDTRATITGVRVLAHTETTGLGDNIELQHSDWILGFAGQRYIGDIDPRWALIADGGEFDAFTGATITPRGVVDAIAQTLRWVNRNQAILLDGRIP